MNYDDFLNKKQHTSLDYGIDPKYYANNIDVFLKNTAINNTGNGNIYITVPFINYWLFLYIFNHYELNIATIRFRGNLTKNLIKNLYISMQSVDLYVDNIPKEELLPILEELLNNNKPSSLQLYWENLNQFINSIRKTNRFKENELFIKYIFEAFEITWFLEETEYTKLKKDLQSWVLPEEEDYHNHVLRKSDIRLDNEIALKFNKRLLQDEHEDQFKNSFILHREIWHNFFIDSHKIKPQSARIINYLYHNRFNKESKYYKDIAQKIDLSAKSVLNSTKEIRDACSSLKCTSIVLETELFIYTLILKRLFLLHLWELVVKYIVLFLWVEKQ